MIELSPTGWVALCATDDGTTRAVPVERFSEDRDALVVDPKSARLVSARALPRFTSLRRTGTPVTAVVSPPGWHVVPGSGGEDNRPSAVQAWLFTDSGHGFPMVANLEDGRWETVGHGANLIGPDTTDSPG